MKTIIIVLIFSFSTWASCPNDVLYQTGSVVQTPLKDQYVKVWTFGSRRLLEESNLTNSKKYEHFKKLVSGYLDVDPVVLLARYQTRTIYQNDLYNLESVLLHNVGRIRKINCLESLLLDFQ